MQRYTVLDADGRIGLTSDMAYPPGGDATVIDYPAGFDFERQRDWRVIDGQLMYDPLPEDAPALTTQEQITLDHDAMLIDLQMQIIELQLGL